MGGSDYSSDAHLKTFYGKLEAIVTTAAALDSFTEFWRGLVLTFNFIEF